MVSKFFRALIPELLLFPISFIKGLKLDKLSLCGDFELEDSSARWNVVRAKQLKYKIQNLFSMAKHKTRDSIVRRFHKMIASKIWVVEKDIAAEWKEYLREARREEEGIMTSRQSISPFDEFRMGLSCLMDVINTEEGTKISIE